MERVNPYYLIITVLLSILGISIFIMSIMKDWPFGIGGLGIALAGFSIEIFIKNNKDATTEKGEKRSEIEIHDERNILVNAKSGEAVNYVMDFFTLIAFILAIYLDVSLIGEIIIFSLLLIRGITRPVTKKYYESRL